MTIRHKEILPAFPEDKYSPYRMRQLVSILERRLNALEDLEAQTTGATGPPGPPGSSGAPGSDGADGVGIPAGGATGEVLAKNSGTDYDTNWVPQTGGGGASDRVWNFFMSR